MAIHVPVLHRRLLSLVIAFSVLLGQTACARETQNQPPQKTVAPSSEQPTASIDTPEKQLDEPQSNPGDIDTENAIITCTAY